MPVKSASIPPKLYLFFCKTNGWFRSWPHAHVLRGGVVCMEVYNEGKVFAAMVY